MGGIFNVSISFIIDTRLLIIGLRDMTAASYSANSTSNDTYLPLTTLKIDVANPFALEVRYETVFIKFATILLEIS